MAAIDYRPLTSEERDVLAWLLEHGGPTAKEFLPQLELIQARPSCACGCPSIEFKVPLDAPYIETRDSIPMFLGQSDEREVGLILLAGSGVLSELEVFTFGETDRPFGLPKIQTLQVAAPGSLRKSDRDSHLP